MLIRISGGVEGIREYLETGKMKGRSATRHDLDERVTLVGNLGITDAVIHDMKGRGDRYLHITISFKEDDVSREDLIDVVYRFEEFAFAAYRSDEYSLYAEAHLPRTKSYTDKSTGLAVDRKPHIHIVIPKKNLLTQGHLNPFGYIPMNIKYIDAFQEEINQQFGFASPKDNVRVEFTKRSDIISRYKGDLFRGANREVRQWALEEILYRDIPSLKELKALLSSRGIVRIRNKGSDSEYLNLKMDGEEKGINFKEYVFSPAFLSLPRSEKCKKIEMPNLGYVEKNECQQLNPELSRITQEWQAIRAKEVKYLNSGRGKEYLYYKNLQREDQHLFLLKKADELYHNLGVNQEIPITEANRHLEEHSQNTEVLNESVLQQCKKERDQNKAILRDIQNPLLCEAKRNIDINRLFDKLSVDKGVRKELYFLTTGADGLPRIGCGSRKYNVADFLTKELHLPWVDASDILCSVYASQIRDCQKEKYSFHQNRWKNYEEKVLSVEHERNREIINLRCIHDKMVSDVRLEYKKRKTEIVQDSNITWEVRKAAISILQIEYLERQKIIKLEMAKRYRLNYSSNNKSILSYFNVHIGGEKDHTEFQIQFSNGIKGNNQNCEKNFRPLNKLLENKILENGDVEYFRQGKKVIRDSGHTVWVLETDMETIEVSLRLALLKYGPGLHIVGCEDFKNKVVEVSAQKNFHIQFDDPELQSKLDKRKNYLNAIQKTIKDRNPTREFDNGEEVIHNKSRYSGEIPLL
jgi:hypothetical protein